MHVSCRSRPPPQWGLAFVFLCCYFIGGFFYDAATATAAAADDAYDNFSMMSDAAAYPDDVLQQEEEQQQQETEQQQQQGFATQSQQIFMESSPNQQQQQHEKAFTETQQQQIRNDSASVGFTGDEEEYMPYHQATASLLHPDQLLLSHQQQQQMKTGKSQLQTAARQLDTPSSSSNSSSFSSNEQQQQQQQQQQTQQQQQQITTGVSALRPVKHHYTVRFPDIQKSAAAAAATSNKVEETPPVGDMVDSTTTPQPFPTTATAAQATDTYLPAFPSSSSFSPSSSTPFVFSSEDPTWKQQQQQETQRIPFFSALPENMWNYRQQGKDWGSTCMTGRHQSPVDLHIEGLKEREYRNLTAMYRRAFSSSAGDDINFVTSSLSSSSSNIRRPWRRGDFFYFYPNRFPLLQVYRSEKVFQLRAASSSMTSLGALFPTDSAEMLTAQHIFFHSPSEHTFQGEANRREVEMQVWHFSNDPITFTATTEVNQASLPYLALFAQASLGLPPDHILRKRHTKQRTPPTYNHAIRRRHTHQYAEEPHGGGERNDGGGGGGVTTATAAPAAAAAAPAAAAAAPAAASGREAAAAAGLDDAAAAMGVNDNGTDSSQTAAAAEAEAAEAEEGGERQTGGEGETATAETASGEAEAAAGRDIPSEEDVTETSPETEEAGMVSAMEINAKVTYIAPTTTADDAAAGGAPAAAGDVPAAAAAGGTAGGGWGMGKEDIGEEEGDLRSPTAHWRVISLTFMSEELDQATVQDLQSLPSERLISSLLQAELVNSTGKQGGETIRLKEPLNLQSLMMMLQLSNTEFFAYDGSSTMPPCQENVRWYVARQPLPVATETMLRFYKMLNPSPVRSSSDKDGNFRALQNVELHRMHNEGNVYLVQGFPLQLLVAASLGFDAMARLPGGGEARALKEFFNLSSAAAPTTPLPPTSYTMLSTLLLLLSVGFITS